LEFSRRKYLVKITIFREEVAGFHAGSLSWSNWNLEMLGFVEGEKPLE